MLGPDLSSVAIVIARSRSLAYRPPPRDARMGEIGPDAKRIIDKQCVDHERPAES